MFSQCHICSITEANYFLIKGTLKLYTCKINNSLQAVTLHKTQGHWMHGLLFRAGREPDGTNAPLIITNGEHMLLGDKLHLSYRMLTHNTPSYKCFFFGTAFLKFEVQSLRVPVRVYITYCISFTYLCTWQPFTCVLRTPDINVATQMLKSVAVWFPSSKGAPGSRLMKLAAIVVDEKE